MDETKIYILKRDDDADLTFEGTRMASAKTSPNQAHGSSYSGSTGRWRKLALYKTAGGKFVCRKTSYSAWQGERYREDDVVVRDDHAGVIRWFGFDRLSKELFDNAELDAAEVVA